MCKKYNQIDPMLSLTIGQSNVTDYYLINYQSRGELRGQTTLQTDEELLYLVINEFDDI